MRSLRSLPPAAVLLLLPALPAAAALVSHWDFENPAAPGDDTGTLNNDAASTTGSPAFSANARVGSGALRLDGQSLLSLGAGSAADYAGAGFAGGFSLAAWVNIDANSPTGPGGGGDSFQRIFSKEMPGGFSANTWGVGMDFSTGGSQTMLGTTYGLIDRRSTSASVIGSWHHVAYVFSAGSASVSFFLDGTLVSTDTSAPAGLNDPGPAESFAIGALNLPATNFQGFRGLLDDLRIYNNPLTAEEVGALAAVPEPGSLLLAGTAGLLCLRRRRV